MNIKLLAASILLSVLISEQAYSSSADALLRNCEGQFQKLNPKQMDTYHLAQLVCMAAVANMLKDIRDRLPLTQDGKALRVSGDEKK